MRKMISLGVQEASLIVEMGETVFCSLKCLRKARVFCPLFDTVVKFMNI